MRSRYSRRPDVEPTTLLATKLGESAMNSMDKKAYKFGLMAAVVAVVIPLLVQTVLVTAAQAASIVA
jgi:hypothetical protein